MVDGAAPVYVSNTQGKELIKHVDENNVELGSVTRGEARSKRLYHRASYVFIYTNGKYLI